MPLVGSLEGHPACKKCCHDSSQKFTFEPAVTLEKWPGYKVVCKPEPLGAVLISETGRSCMTTDMGPICRVVASLPPIFY